MNVAEIPANTLVEMTSDLYQEFCQGGCVPACHFTNEWISIGDQFHLSTVRYLKGGGTSGLWPSYTPPGVPRPSDDVLYEDRDVMLSAAVTVEQYNEAERKKLADGRKAHEQWRRGGCYRVNGNIVI